MRIRLGVMSFALVAALFAASGCKSNCCRKGPDPVPQTGLHTPSPIHVPGLVEVLRSQDHGPPVSLGFKYCGRVTPESPLREWIILRPTEGFPIMLQPESPYPPMGGGTEPLHYADELILRALNNPGVTDGRSLCATYAANGPWTLREITPNSLISTCNCTDPGCGD